MKRFLFFLSLYFTCTVAIAHTINWYVDGSVYHTTTCESGDDITPPTAPEKYGYHLKEWRQYYTVVEYLESTGAQWIDTGYFPNQDTHIKAKFVQKANAGNGSVFFGAAESLSGARYDFFNWGGVTVNYGAQKSGAGDAIKKDSVIEIDFDKNVCSFVVDGVTHISKSFEYSTFAINNSLYVFSDNIPIASDQYRTSMILYYFKIWDNDILVRDFIPVIDPNGIPCMYDKVESKFYYSVGTDNFVAGPVM